MLESSEATTGPAPASAVPEPADPPRREHRHRRHSHGRRGWKARWLRRVNGRLGGVKRLLNSIDWPAASRRWGLPAAAVLVAFLVPTFFFILRAWVDGDAVVVDQRAGIVAPGPIEGAPAGGAVVVRVPPEGVALPPGTREARVQLRLTSWRRSRILLITGPRGPFDIRPAWPEDGTCFDLGPLPAAGTTATYRVRAVWPERRWGLTPAPPLLGDLVDVRLGDAPLDYRVVAHVPVGPIEALARLTFFLRISGLAASCLLLAFAGLTCGVRWWLDGATSRSVAAVVIGMAALFVAVTPPFQAADESRHIGTLEYVVAGTGRGTVRYWLGSIAMATNAVGLDAVRYKPESALPLGSPASRSEMARVLALAATGEARFGVAAAPSDIQPSDEAPLFYPVAAAIPGSILGKPLAARLYTYRILAVAGGVGLTVLALAMLALAGLRPDAAVGCLAVVLIPQWIGIVSSTTPYSPGLGASVLATSLIAGSMALRRWRAFVWLLAAAAVAIVGGLMVRECYPLAPLALALALWRVVRPRTETDGENGGSALFRALLLFGVLAGAAAGVAALVIVERGLPANMRVVATLIERRKLLTDTLPHWLPVIVSPLLAAGALVVAQRWAYRRASPRAFRWIALAPALAVVVFLVATMLVFPDARVPTSARADGMTIELFLRRVVKAIAVTALSFDQDFITWKSFFCALGWQDVLLPPVMYAVARWLLLATFLAIPFLFLRASTHNRREAARLLALLAAATTILLFIIVMRSSAAILHGRYLLFIGPLLGIALSRLAFLRRDWSPLVVPVGALLVLDLLVALYLIPCRYFLAGAGISWAVLP